MKKILLTLTLVAVVLSMWYFSTRSQVSLPAVPSQDTQVALAPEVENVLDQEITTLGMLAQDPVVISETQKSNQKNKDLTKAEIDRLDRDWQQSKTITPFIRMFLENATAERLLAFQKNHPGFKEIFVADAYGLNVGQTDKTSDYYQADESWWTDSFNAGKGKTFHGKIEFDASSQTEAISIYIPIMNPESGAAIGVLKGVLDLLSIKNSL